MTGRLFSLGVAAVAGLAAWLSMGAVAVTDAASHARVGFLPPFWLLLACVAASLVATWALRASPARVAPLALTALVCLPWLPGRVPAAFLIWQGPMAVVVWGLTAVALVAPCAVRVAPLRALTSPAVAPRVVAVAAAIAFTAGAWGIEERRPSGDEPHYLVITQSLLRDRDLRIENNHRRGDYAAYFRGELRPDYLRRGLDGQIYSIHAPGVSALVLPAFAVGGYPLTVVFLIALASLAASLLWVVTWRLSNSAAAAWVATVGIWGSTPMFFQAFAVYPDAAGAAATTVGVWALARLARGEAVSATTLAAVGAALACLPWLHTRFAVIAGLLGGMLALRLLARGRWRAMAALFAVPVVSAAAWFAFFHAIWGTFSPTAPYGGYTQSSISHWIEGIPGLLFDQQFGLVTTAPIFGAAIVGAGALARRQPRLAVETGLLFVAYLLAVALYRMWWGGTSTPARFLVAVLPVLALPMAMAWSRLGACGRAVMVVLLLLSLTGTVVRAAVENGALLFNVRDGTDLVLDRASRLVSLPLALPSLHRDAPADALRDSAVWIAALAACLLATGRLNRRIGQPWLLAVSALATAAMLASTTTWLRYGTRSITTSASAMDLLRRWPRRPVALGWQSRPFRIVDPADVPPLLVLSGSGRAAEPEGRVAVFRAPLVPAGEYEVQVVGSPRLDGVLDVRVGRTSQIADTLALAGPAGPPILRLPVDVHSVTLVTGEEVAALIDRLVLRPIRVGHRDAPPRGLAQRAVRYGNVRCYQMDEGVFLEPSGLWTRGDEEATLVFDVRTAEGAQPGRRLGLGLRAGGAPVTVTLSADDWHDTRELAPGGIARITLPEASAGLLVVHTRTEGGFRPIDHDPATRDPRYLGVWISVGDEGATPPEPEKPAS